MIALLMPGAALFAEPVGAALAPDRIAVARSAVFDVYDYQGHLLSRFPNGSWPGYSNTPIPRLLVHHKGVWVGAEDRSLTAWDDHGLIASHGFDRDIKSIEPLGHGLLVNGSVIWDPTSGVSRPFFAPDAFLIQIAANGTTLGWEGVQDAHRKSIELVPKPSEYLSMPRRRRGRAARLVRRRKPARCHAFGWLRASCAGASFRATREHPLERQRDPR